MNKLSLLRFGLLICVCFLSFSCIKKYGCRNQAALNYEMNADLSDNSCVYYSSGFFYWYQNTYQKFVDTGATSISIYLDDVLIGSDSTSNYVVSSPSCSQNQAVNFSNLKVFDDDYWKVQIKVIDQLNRTLMDYPVSISEGYCNQIELFFI